MAKVRHPFFIVGASRSGTTMMRLLLNAHSRIGVPKELAYFERCARAGLFNIDSNTPLDEARYRDLIRGFLTKKRLALEGIDLERLEKNILEAGPPNLGTPFRMTMDAWGEKEGKTTWGEKTPKNLFYADLIFELLPDARFIYVVRDPRAVVYSMNRFPRFVDDSVLNAFNWLQAATTGYDLLEKSVPAQRRMFLRYEDLVADVEGKTRSICEFLEEPYEPAMMEFYTKSRGDIHPNSTQLGGVNTLTKPISTVSVDKWREHLPARDIAMIEAVCGDAMGRLEYEKVGGTLSFRDRLNVSAKLRYCNLQQRRNRHLRAYQIAFKPFEKTKSWLRGLISK